jgi:hypothetical protein
MLPRCTEPQTLKMKKPTVRRHRLCVRTFHVKEHQDTERGLLLSLQALSHSAVGVEVRPS